ncbi:MAG: RnfABCDGE type electron transport complex subunit D, partial [Spirochaetaceae bacterium]|nr:RnfABCDGE type electron transport complex subunit D [Spirochaetaceae bacterium]
MKRDRELALVDAPFVHHPRTTSSMMWGIVAALSPAAGWAIFCFGPAAALPIAAALVSSLIGETLVGAARGRFTLGDGSAILTGLLIGLAMPPSVPLYIPAASALFSVALVKGAFGGLGENWMNPALAGIVFANLNWPKPMSTWLPPLHVSGAEALSGATPLSFARAGGAIGKGSSPLDVLSSGGVRFSGLDGVLTDALNGSIFAAMNAELPSGYIDLLIGNRPGAMGELSCVLILAASVFAIARSMIRAEIPASIVGSFIILNWAFGGIPYGAGFFAGDALFALFSGSFL